MKTQPIIGIGLLLFSGSQIMTVQELKSKPEIHKTAGMVSFPLETFERGKDKHMLHTIYRLLREELGIHNRREVRIDGIVMESFQLIPGRSDVTTYYGFGFFLGDPHQEFTPEDDDIIIAGWKTPEHLLDEQFKRVEVEPILTHYAKHYLA